MGRRGRNRGLPKWYKGQKFLDNIDGSEIFERDGSMFIQEGKKVSKANFDKLTDIERQESIRR